MSWRTAEEAIQTAQKAIGITCPEWDIQSHQMHDGHFVFTANRGSWSIRPISIDTVGVIEYRAALSLDQTIYSRYGTTVHGAMRRAVEEADRHLQELTAELQSAKKEIP